MLLQQGSADLPTFVASYSPSAGLQSFVDTNRWTPVAFTEQAVDTYEAVDVRAYGSLRRMPTLRCRSSRGSPCEARMAWFGPGAPGPGCSSVHQGWPKTHDSCQRCDSAAACTGRLTTAGSIARMSADLRGLCTIPGPDPAVRAAWDAGPRPVEDPAALAPSAPGRPGATPPLTFRSPHGWDGTPAVD